MTLYSAAHSVKLWQENVSYVAVECCQDSTAEILYTFCSLAGECPLNVGGEEVITPPAFTRFTRGQ